MKVLLIDVNCKYSSTGKIVYDLYSYLNRNGDDAAVCYGRGPIIYEKNVYKFGLDWETYLHALLTRITGFTGCFSFLSTRRLLRFIKEYKPDVVHIHELHAYFVNIKPLLKYLKVNSIKTIMTLHCEFNYTGKCGHSVECEKWKFECRRCPHLRDYPATLFFDHTHYMFLQKKKLFFKFPNLVISTPSKWLAERVAHSFLKDFEVKVIHNGIDTDVFRPVNTSVLRKKLGISDNERVVLAVAPNLMSKEKGGEHVLQISSDLVNENIRFILIGVDGRNKYNNKNINKNVVILNRISDKNLLVQYYSLADAFLICSETENYPTTCLEAQACGTPVFGFSSGGIIETSLLDEETHFVEYANVKGLENILKLVEHKSQESINALRVNALSKFKNIESVKRYTNLYI